MTMKLHQFYVLDFELCIVYSNSYLRNMNYLFLLSRSVYFTGISMWDGQFAYYSHLRMQKKKIDKFEE